MKNIRCSFLMETFSVYLNRYVLVMSRSTLFTSSADETVIVQDCHSKLGHAIIYHSTIRGSCKKFCHWVRITLVLRFITYLYYKPSKYSPLLKHIFLTFLPSREKADK